MSQRRQRFGAALMRAALSALFALCIGGCEFARTNVPYNPWRGASSDDWNALRTACAEDGRVPVQLYQWAVVRSETALDCEPLGQVTRAPPEDR